jgi:hypothetical protein
MRLHVLDQVHLSSVSSSSLGSGAEVDVSDALGRELLEKHPDKFKRFDQVGGQGAGQDDRSQVLREDGPTLQEYLERGYKASAYPPRGYASKADAAELEQAIAAECDTDEKEKEQARLDAEQRASANAAALIASGGSGAGAGADGAKAEPAPANKAETAPTNKADKPHKSKGAAGE